MMNFRYDFVTFAMSRSRDQRRNEVVRSKGCDNQGGILNIKYLLPSSLGALEPWSPSLKGNFGTAIQIKLEYLVLDFRRIIIAL